MLGSLELGIVGSCVLDAGGLHIVLNCKRSRLVEAPVGCCARARCVELPLQDQIPPGHVEIPPGAHLSSLV